MEAAELMRKRMAGGWIGGLQHGTVCGRSSTIHATREIRSWLPWMVWWYGIGTVNDAGAGDLHWIKSVNWQVEYSPFDLVPHNPEVALLDITTEVMPPCDLILCRATLNHLDKTRVQMAIDLFRRSGRYLLATQFVDRKDTALFSRYDLRLFGLDEPIDSIPDTCGEGSELALWRL